VIGVAREYCEKLSDLKDVCGQLEIVQSRLLDVGSAVATPLDKASKQKMQRAAFPKGLAEDVEKWIDDHDEQLPPLKNFILPSGGEAASFLHMARTICRRAERRIVPLIREDMLQEEVGQYVNRLSDYLFTAARVAAKAAHKTEVVYKKTT
jgi:ATP:cob(I)alamin adenosyltransferase